MKWLWVLAFSLTVVGCGNDAELPTLYHRDYLAQPTGVAIQVDGDEVRVSWEMDARANVIGFVVAFIDGTGAEQTHLVADSEATFYQTSNLIVDSDTSVQVWAVDGDDFYGPRSVAATVPKVED
mgnify:CR=1 FL=1